jgi:putative spermidine/putrescine transport system permease protein
MTSRAFALRAAAAHAGGSPVSATPLSLALPLTLFFALFVFVPLLLLVFVSLHNDSAMTARGVGQYAKFLSDGFNLGVLGSTLALGVKVTLLTLSIGYPLAYLYTLAPRRWQGPLMLLILLPLLTSSVVRTFAWVVILSRQGIVNSLLLKSGLIDTALTLLYTPGAVAVALAQIELPLMVLPLITALSNIDPNLRQASLALGAGRWRTLFQVTLPLSMPGLLAGCLLVFASSVSAFVTQTLVGGGRHIFMPFYIYQQAIQANDYPFAAAVAVVLLGAVLLVVTLMNLLGRRSKGFAHG